MKAEPAPVSELQRLIDAVVKDPGPALSDASPAADALVAHGPSALPSIQHVLNGHWQSQAHGKDVLEAFMYIARRIHGDK